MHPLARLAQSGARATLHTFPFADDYRSAAIRQDDALARLLRPDAESFALEDREIRAYAQEDPRGLLSELGDSAVA